MRRMTACALGGALLAAMLCMGSGAGAQPAEAVDQQEGVEFVRLYERVQAAPEPEEKIALAERALAIEATLKHWPLHESRAFVRGELSSRAAFAYMARRQGDRAGNLEKAIEHYERSLTARPREAFPQDWSNTQVNLAIAYRGRLRGVAADNVEKAIACLEAALTVATREAAPETWARAQTGLGSTYRMRIRGVRADNLEEAIAHHEAALTVLTRAASPQSWARIQSNLALVYSERIRGERADNLEHSIARHEATLAEFTREALPQDWAQTQAHLGIAYQDRIRGERAGNMEKAIAYHEAALSVFTRERFPRDWARTHNNLAIAYSRRVRGEPAGNIEQQIAHYEAALTVRTRETDPQEWARTQTNLATAYESRIRGERADNLERAIGYHQAALTVRTREAFPQLWARTQHNLANTYRDRVRGRHDDNLKEAITRYEAALTVRTRETLPREHLRTARLLGGAYLERGDWHKAGLAYASAREAFLLLFGLGLDAGEGRDLMDQAGPLFAEAAFSAAQRGEAEAALSLASEGRARLMAVALRLQSLNLPAGKRRRLEDLRTAIRAAEDTGEVAQGSERDAATDALAKLRSELLDLVKSASRSEAGSAIGEARKIIAAGGAIAMPVLTKAGSKLLIVTAGGKDGGKLTVMDLPELTTSKLTVLMRGEPTGGPIQGWLGVYNINYLEDAAELDRRWPEWLAAVDGLGPQLWGLLGARLHAALQEHGLAPGSRLIWLPSGGLGIVPVGLAQDPATKRRLADTYEIAYAPSLEALAAAQQQLATAAPHTLAMVINPTGDLAGTEKEGGIVASYFQGNSRNVLRGEAATPEAVLAALKGRSHWHFASHGTFEWDDPRKSALIMHGLAPLSVEKLLATEGLGRPRLVVLSACETGLYDINRNPDEFMGLPGAFAALGAAGVLGTLWPVSDDATALLIAKFYELHLGAGLTPAAALSRAQVWLREAEDSDLRAYAKLAAAQGHLESRYVAEIERARMARGPERSRSRGSVELAKPGTGNGASGIAAARPYAHPYYWAGFILTGL
jgi:CHAT domain-containing protein/tetratricopeptide (TPR) repeat protein